MTSLIVLLILVLLALLYIDYLVATEFNHIAEQKGYSESNKYFWYCFWLGIVGYLMVIALPDNSHIGSKKIVINGNPTTEKIRTYCPYCERMISIPSNTKSVICPLCNKKIEVE